MNWWKLCVAESSAGVGLRARLPRMLLNDTLHPVWRIAGVVITAMLCVAPTAAQFYEKVDLSKAAIDVLDNSLTGTDPSTGSYVAGIAGTNDPGTEALFRAMVRNSHAGPRVYGVLGTALISKKGIDPDLMATITARDERAAIIREANITGLLRASPVSVILAQGNFSDAAMLSLVAELDRRNEEWDPTPVRALAVSNDPVAAGFAALLLRDGSAKNPSDSAAWDAFRARLLALPPAERNGTMRALVEATMIFELKSAAPPLLELARTENFTTDTRIGAIGMALRIDTPNGVAAWQDHVAANRSQTALVRAGLQLLASSDRGIPPTAFDAIRNGNQVLDAMADTGAAISGGKDPVDALIKLLDAGHPLSAEWALIRASELPPESSGLIWKHLLTRMDDPDPANRPTNVLISGLARELMKSDPTAVGALVERVKNDPNLVVAAMTGVNDSCVAAGADIARARRGSLPRAGEGLAVLIIARAGAPLSDNDLDVLGRAAAGGGDLDALRTLQAAWFYARARNKTNELIARIAGEAAPMSTPAVPTATPPQ